jgi:outer membrane protein TolC
MKRSFTKILYLSTIMVSLFSLTEKAKAQETMIPDISYLYLEKLISTAKTNYPLLKQLDVKQKIEEYNIKNAKLSWFNSVNALYLSQPVGGAVLVNPLFSSGVQLAINFNLAQTLQTPNNIKIAKQQLEFAKETSNQYESTIEVQIKTRYFTYIQQLNSIKLFTKSLQDAEGLVQNLRLKYERGEVEFRDYSEALINFSSLSKQKLEAEAGYLTAKASIEELTITKLEDIK